VGSAIVSGGEEGRVLVFGAPVARWLCGERVELGAAVERRVEGRRVMVVFVEGVGVVDEDEDEVAVDVRAAGGVDGAATAATEGGPVVLAIGCCNMMSMASTFGFWMAEGPELGWVD
jgi:hypothetical protein